jgi:IclR family KDG regulon transcriptional repressor
MSALIHGVHVLQCFSEQRQHLSVSEISRMLGLSKRLLTRMRTGTYRLGVPLFELGSIAVLPFEPERVAGPIMSDLVRQTGETVHLGILDGYDLVYIHKITSPYALNTVTRTGKRIPAHTIAGGKAILAYHPELLAEMTSTGMERLTPHTVTDMQELQRQVEQIRRVGYAIADEEHEMGVRAVAAPVRTESGDVMATVSLAGPVTRMPSQRLHSLAPLVISAARQISSAMGYGDRPRSRTNKKAAHC